MAIIAEASLSLYGSKLAKKGDLTVAANKYLRYCDCSTTDSGAEDVTGGIEADLHLDPKSGGYCPTQDGAHDNHGHLNHPPSKFCLCAARCAMMVDGITEEARAGGEVRRAENKLDEPGLKHKY